MVEIPSLYSQRPIVARHQKAALYHPFIEAVAMTLVDVPITFVTSLVFGTIIYEAVRLQQSASQFLWVYPCFILSTIPMSYRFVQHILSRLVYHEHRHEGLVPSPCGSFGGRGSCTGRGGAECPSLRLVYWLCHPSTVDDWRVALDHLHQCMSHHSLLVLRIY